MPHPKTSQPPVKTRAATAALQRQPRHFDVLVEDEDGRRRRATIVNYRFSDDGLTLQLIVQPTWQPPEAAEGEDDGE